MEPGSTFKIVVVSARLNEGVVRLDRYHLIASTASLPMRAGRCTTMSRCDILTAESIITKSSNIGAAKIGIQLGEAGFTITCGISASASAPAFRCRRKSRGILHPVKNWSKVSIAQIPMGQGVAVTRLQMAMAMCAIANNGV